MAVSVVSALTYAVTTAVTTGAWITFSTFLTLTATFAALGALNRSLMGKAEFDTIENAYKNLMSPVGTRKILYGKTRVGGTIIWHSTKPSTSNTMNSPHRIFTTHDSDNQLIFNDNGYLDIIIAIAGHTIEDIEKIYFDDRRVWDKLLYTPNNANLTGFFGTGVSERFGFTFYDGSQTSGHDIDAATNSTWSNNHTLSGVAHVYLTLVYDAEFYRDGIPNISFVVKGKKIYDPRRDSTSALHDSNLGSAHRKDTPSTWEYSENPALCLLDYMRDETYGLGESYTNFDETALGVAIDDCDEPLITKEVGVSSFLFGRQYKISLAADTNWTSIGAPNGNVDTVFTFDNSTATAGGNGLARTVMSTFSCHGEIDSANPIKKNIESLLSSMGGSLQYTNGLFYISAYAYKTEHPDPINEDDLCQPIEIITKASRRTLYNAVKGRFNSSADNYIPTDFPVQASSSFATDDGETLFMDLDLPFTTNETQAQRLAKLLMFKSRLQLTVKVYCKLTAMKYRVGDNIKFTNTRFGWTNKIFEIVSFRLVPNVTTGLQIEMELVENSSVAYNWAFSDELDFETSEEPTADLTSLTTPSNITAGVMPTLLDSQYGENIRIDWEAVQDARLENYEVTVFINFSPISTTYITTDNFLMIPNPLLPARYFIRVVAKGTDQTQSGTGELEVDLEKFLTITPSTHIVEITTALPDTPTESFFADAVGRDPVKDDILLIIRVDSTGNVLESQEYIFIPEIQSILSSSINYKVAAPSGNDAVLTYRFDIDVSDTATVSWSFTKATDALSVRGFFKNFGSQSNFNFDTPVLSNNNRTANVTFRLPNSEYANRTGGLNSAIQQGLIDATATIVNDGVTTVRTTQVYVLNVIISS